MTADKIEKGGEEGGRGGKMRDEGGRGDESIL